MSRLKTKYMGVKESLSIPVIASLNAVNNTTWIKYARMLNETGVDGIEALGCLA